MSKPRFVHLRVHSDYSIIDGIAKIELLVKKASSMDMPAIAITDFTNLCGLLKFYKIAYSVGMKPIVGADFYTQNKQISNEISQMTLLAMNNIGFQNLKLLISRAYQHGYSVTGPCIDSEWLVELNRGLILISGGRMGDIGKSLLCGNRFLARKYIAFYKKFFPDRFYLEIVRTGRSNEENYLNYAIEIAEQSTLPIVATNDVRFIDRNDFDAHEVRVAIQNGFILDDPGRPYNYSFQQYMRSEEEMCELFSDIPEALENSVEIAKRCNVTIHLGEYFLPKFPTGNMTTEDFLILQSKKGLEERLIFLFQDEKERKKHRAQYDNRLNVELQIINQMGFPGYFLIVMEFVQWAKENNIPVGPGRGSGTGSLVAYSLKITELDPIKFNLIFERFLNPERISLPDFDIDFCMIKRDKMIEHMIHTYGSDSVSQIITFGTMTAKAVIRDVGRVLGYPYSFVDRISKLIPSEYGMTLIKALDIEQKLLKIYKIDEEVKILIDMARKLEGVIRTVGKHAGGIVIAPSKITDFAPIYCDETGQNPVIQFDKNDVECTGLVKFDFLGLRTLTIIDWALKMINKRREIHGKLPIEITTIPLDDKKCFEMLQRSETTAIFQLESRGMKDLIKRLHPDCFEDLIALVALFRPGPLQSGMVDNFINRKHGREKISYPDYRCQHKSLKPILESTYGIILYQEQVMQIAQILSGYTLGRADVLRRAMGKKDPKEMAKQRSIFEEGAKKNGIDSKTAIKIFNLLEKFASYGFNKSHSSAYALLSYQTLWLKTHYPEEFMAAAMTADIDNSEKVFELIDACWKMGIRILSPDINTGMYYFYVNENREIVYGIGAIKGVGEESIKEIINARNNNGCFRDLFDLCSRIDTKKLNRHILEKLIMSGALDKLGLHRAALMNSLDDAIKASVQHAKANSIGQTDMFDFSKEKLKEFNKSYTNSKLWTEKVLLDNERKTLGFYLTGHPINQYVKEIEHYIGKNRIKDIQPSLNNEITTIAGLVISVKITPIKNGERIGICTLDDNTGHIEVILFSSILNKYYKFLEKDRLLIVNGKVIFDKLRKKLKIFACKVTDIEKVREKYTRNIAIFLTDSQIKNQVLNQLCQSLEIHRSGNTPVYLYHKKINVYVRLYFNTSWYISPKERVLNDLRSIVGSKHVELEFN